MLVAVLTLISTTDVPTTESWKELALRVIAQLPEVERSGIDHLAIDDLHVIQETGEASWATRVQTDTARNIGVTLWFWNRDRALSSLRISIELESVDPKNNAPDIKAYGQRAIEIARALRPYYAAWKVTSTRVGPQDIYVQCSPMIGDIQSTEAFHSYFRRTDGKFFHVNGTVPLDYSRPYGKLITKEQAIQNAWSAYYRYQPFPVSRLSYAELRLSTYTQHALMEHAGSELTDGELAMAKHFVAVPLYVIGINIGTARGPAQTITVDAQTGKVKTIWDAGGAIGGGAHVKDELVGSEQIELTIGRKKSSAKLIPDVEPLKLIHKDWKVVPVSSATDSYAARLDPAERLWLAGNDGWYCYSLSDEAMKAAIAAQVTGPKFGAPKSD